MIAVAKRRDGHEEREKRMVWLQARLGEGERPSVVVIKVSLDKCAAGE